MTTPDQRATDLLHSILSPGEARCLRDKGYVPVAAKSGRRYRVSAHDVYEMDSNTGTETVAHLCVVPKIAGIPEGDKLLAKYLMIKGNEDAFRMKAIRHDYRNPFAEEWWRNHNEIAGQEIPPPYMRDFPFDRMPERPQERQYDRYPTIAEWGRDVDRLYAQRRHPYDAGYGRHANRFIRFTQDMRHTGPDWQAYNYGLPPNVQANAERNTITYEGVEYRIINQTVENPPAFYGHPARTVTLEVEPVNQPVGRWTDGGEYLDYRQMAEQLAANHPDCTADVTIRRRGECDVYRGAGMTTTVSLGPDEQARIEEYLQAGRNMTTVSLYGSQWYVTSFDHEYGPEGPEIYTFSLVRR